jgi:hypothetical protein
MADSGFFTDSEATIQLSQFKAKLQEAALALINGRIAKGSSVGFGTEDIFDQLEASVPKWYKLSWGIDSRSKPSKRPGGLGEILFWGDPQGVHSLLCAVVESAVNFGLSTRRIESSGGSRHELVEGGRKEPDFQWKRGCRKITVMEAVWRHETMQEFDEEIDRHAESGYNTIGVKATFHGVAGNAAAVRHLGQMLSQGATQADLEAQVSILLIAKEAHGNSKVVWRMGDWADSAEVSGGKVEKSKSTQGADRCQVTRKLTPPCTPSPLLPAGQVALLPSKWFTPQKGQGKLPVFLRSYRPVSQ